MRQQVLDHHGPDADRFVAERMTALAGRRRCGGRPGAGRRSRPAWINCGTRRARDVDATDGYSPRNVGRKPSGTRSWLSPCRQRAAAGSHRPRSSGYCCRRAASEWRRYACRPRRRLCFFSRYPPTVPSARTSPKVMLLADQLRFKSRQLFSLTSTSNFLAALLIRCHAWSLSASETPLT